MKNRECKGPPSADLLVCFPSRAHLRLMPKPICSPAHPSESVTSQHHRQRQRHHHHQRKPSISRGAGHASPLLWTKTKPNNNSDISEPTSPKVTCAGQIKVRPKTNTCKNWQSVMEEIERLHNKSKQKKKSAWIESLGFKKDAMQFLTCLRNLRFDFRCFGSYPTAVISSDDEDDEEENREEMHDQNSRAVFSKWFMILPENHAEKESNNNKGKMIRQCLDDEEESCKNGDDDSISRPPPNALLLMRCRSAPAKSWLEEKLEEEEEKEKEKEKDEVEVKQRVLVMTCGDEFSKLSADIAKETWVVGGIKDMLSRSRSSKR